MILDLCARYHFDWRKLRPPSDPRYFYLPLHVISRHLRLSSSHWTLSDLNRRQMVNLQQESGSRNHRPYLSENTATQYWDHEIQIRDLHIAGTLAWRLLSFLVCVFQCITLNALIFLYWQQDEAHLRRDSEKADIFFHRQYNAALSLSRFAFATRRTHLIYPPPECIEPPRQLAFYVNTSTRFILSGVSSVRCTPAADSD
ncbi:hypothetical protein EDD85DRAFT_352128 [Armillaria nabsnona]|nr:hypothetical protein EDD85DRAFT_352128 [Armillaria nabsnona]